LMLIYLAWVEIALLLFMLFLGPQPMPPLSEFVSNLLLLFFGLVIMFPLIGHATWHAFCDLVERSDGS
jgi:uncharacterized membrane protein